MPPLRACCAGLAILKDTGILDEGHLRSLARTPREIVPANAIHTAINALLHAAGSHAPG